MIRDTLGPSLRAMRERVGLRQKDVADTVDIPQSQLSRWEAGITEPKLDHIEVYAAACNMRADLVFTPTNVKIKRWGHEAHEAADIVEAATPEDRVLFLTVLRRMAGGGR